MGQGFILTNHLINYMSPVGRPPQKDKNGEIITRSTVNVTIPSRLAEFLKEKGENRSKLFTMAATQLYEGEICSTCYTKDVKDTVIGMRCDGPCGRYSTFFYKYHRCESCNLEFKSGRLPIELTNGSNVKVIICEPCNVNSK